MVDNYVRNIIDKFEYSEAKGFYYFEDIPFEKCMPNVRNVLLQLKPLAVYMVQETLCFFLLLFWGRKETSGMENLECAIRYCYLYFKNNDRNI